MVIEERGTAGGQNHKVGLRAVHAWVGRACRRPQALGAAPMGARSGPSGGRALGAPTTQRNGGETARA